MRKLFLFIAVAFIAIGALGQSEKNILWSMRITPKMDKIGEIEKRLPLFLKTHYPQLGFRVYETITGPNTGSFVVSSGPYSFKELDAEMQSPKGEAARKADDLALSALYEKMEVNFNRMLPDVSLMDPNMEIKYVQITVREYESGGWGAVRDILVKLKAAREKGPKLNILFTQPVAGGSNMNTYGAARFFNNWADLDINQNIPELYDNLHGRAAWSDAVRTLNAHTKSITQEVRVLRKDLSTATTLNK